MGEVIADHGYESGVCGHDGTVWVKVLVDAEGHLQVDVIDSGGADLKDLLDKLDDCLTALEKIDDLQNALDSVGTDELDVNVESSVLPSGAATSANQTSMITALQLIDDLRNALNSVATDELDVVIDGQSVDVEVTQTTPADLVVAQHQYDGSAWRKSNLLWGYNDVVSEAKSDTNLDEGENTLSGTTVGANEVWVISAISGYVTSATITDFIIQASVDSVICTLLMQTDPTSGQWYLVTGQFVLKEDDFIRIYVKGATANDDAYFRYCGYKMDIAM